MGRARVITANNKRHLTKAEKEARSKAETLKVGREDLLDFEHLDGLSEAGAALYKKIALKAIWLDDLSKPDLINYVIAWERAREIVMSPDARREVLAVATSDGRRIIRNPLLSAWLQYTKEMRSCSLKLGLSAVDRLKLVEPPKEEAPPNKWIRFLEEG